MHLRWLISPLLLALATATALADSYPVSGSYGDFHGSGTLTATNEGGGTYQVINISDPTDGVTGLVGTQPGYRGNDNLLMPGQNPVLDGHGFAFTDVLGDTDYTVNIFGTGTGQYSAWVLDSDGYEQEIAVDFMLGQENPMALRNLAALPVGATRTFGYQFSQAVAPTPEPTSVALLGTGLLGVAGLLRRKR